MNHCNVIYLQYKTCNLSVQSGISAQNFEVFRCLGLFSLNLLSLLVLARAKAWSQSTEGSYILVSLENGQQEQVDANQDGSAGVKGIFPLSQL